MIFRKDPLIKKLFLILVAGLGLVGLFLVVNSLFFVRGINEASGSVPWQGFIAGNIALVIILVMVNILLFLGMMRYIVDKLDRLSAAVDKLMEGEYTSFAEEEEGIFSRLESRFSQVSRKMERGFASLSKGKENLQSLVTDLSHQIKTPLSAVKVFYTLLKENQLSPQERNEFFDRLKEQIDKLEWLSDGLIKISKMETGMIRIKKEPADIKETILAGVSEVYGKALEKNLEIDVGALQSLGVPHDVKWTKETIVNVLENSIKYTEVGGKISVHMEKMETYIKIDIQDNGIGIPPQEIGKVFHRFYRGESQQVAATQGTGIGLYLSRKILEEQGGTIVAGSMGEGMGSRFTILLML